MTRIPHTQTMGARLCGRLRAFLVAEMTLEEEAFDQAQRQREWRVPAGLSLLLLVLVSAACCAVIIHFAKVVL